MGDEASIWVLDRGSVLILPSHLAEVGVVSQNRAISIRQFHTSGRRAPRSNLGALYAATADRDRRLRALSRALRTTFRSAAESQA